LVLSLRLSWSALQGEISLFSLVNPFPQLVADSLWTTFSVAYGLASLLGLGAKFQLPQGTVWGATFYIRVRLPAYLSTQRGVLLISHPGKGFIAGLGPRVPTTTLGLEEILLSASHSVLLSCVNPWSFSPGTFECAEPFPILPLGGISPL